MSLRAILNHAAIKITPAPRTLQESREIYKSLRKFGEIDLYRSLRHETSTLEAKEDAIVLFRDEASIQDAFEASPVNVSMSIVQPSSIPVSNHHSTSTPSSTQFSDNFTIEILRREYNHETRIIDQLFAYKQAPYSITRETPPATSISAYSKSDMGRVPDANEYRQNIARATGGGWKSWRLEMKQAGIPTWASIKPTSDVVMVAPQGANPSRSRMALAGWGRPLDASDSERQSVVGLDIPRPVSSIISDPAPLPLDPTLQSYRRQRTPPTERPIPRGAKNWLRGTSSTEERSSQPPSKQALPEESPTVESDSKPPSEPLSFRAKTQNENGSPPVTRSLNGELVAPLTDRTIVSSDNLVGTQPTSALSDVDIPPIIGTKSYRKSNKENFSEHMPTTLEIQKPQQEDATLKSGHTIPLRVKNAPEQRPSISSKDSLGIESDEAAPIKDVQPELAATPEQKPEVDAAREPAPAQRRWWSLPWQR